MENNKTPSIRFKGFIDPWEQRKFGDGMDLLTGYPFESEKFSDNGINLIRGMNVKRGYLDLSNSLCMKWKSSEGLEKYLLENEDILIQMDGALIGKSYAKIKETQLPALLVQRVTRARAIPEKSNSDFMYQTIQRDFLKYIILNKTDSAIPHLSLNDIREFPIRVPNLEEQKKIGEYFSNLDNLITLHQRKYDKLQNIKKSMLEKMFPKNGSNVPEIRFSGFTDPWEQRKLGDVVQITMGQSPEGSTYSDEPSDYILVQGNADLQNGWVCPRIWTTQITKKADAGDLIMSVRAPAGAMGKTAYNAVIGRGVAAIKGNEFIYQLLVKMDADGFWKTLSCGSTFESLNSDNIKNAEVKIPTTAEQIKIGDYFQQFDNLITLHQRELEKLQNIKKSMLEKMFV
jgi:type I restriction enzyme S subunit